MSKSDEGERLTKIQKGAKVTLDGIVEDILKRNPRMSKAEATAEAWLRPETSELVRDERAALHGESYR